MTTARLALEKLVAGASTRANLISYWNSNADILDALIKGTGLSGGQTIYGGTGASENLNLGSTAHATKGLVQLAAGDKFSMNSVLPLHEFMQYGDVFGTAYSWNFCTHYYLGGIRFGTFNDLAYALMMSITYAGVWIAEDCSAKTFTDRTPAFAGDALAAIEKIKPLENGEIDHATLPEFVIMPYQNERGEWWPGRSLGDMISVLVKAAQERSVLFAAAIADRDKKLSLLEARIVALEKSSPAKA